jgi:hypothetical protein
MVVPMPERSSRGVLLAVGGLGALVMTAGLVVGGYFLVRNLTADKEQPTDPEVVANTPPDRKPTGQAPLQPNTTKTDAVAKLADPITVKLDGPVSALYAAGEGRYVLFHLSTAGQLVVYDVAARQVSATIPNVDKNDVVAAGRSHVFVGRRTPNRIVKYDLTTGEELGTINMTGSEYVRHMAIGVASDGPLVAVTYSTTSRTHLRLYDPESLGQINAPIEDPSKTGAAFPIWLSSQPSHAAVSADGGTIAVSDRLYTRTEAGYKARQINSSSGLRPVGDGSLAVGNSLIAEGRSVKLADRSINWALPCANGAFFIVADYPAARELRLTLYADPDAKPLGDLPAADASRWLGGNTSPSALSLGKHYAVLPELGVAVFCATGSQEATITPIDMIAMAAQADRDFLFTTVPPVEAVKGRPYTHTASAVSRNGARPTFTLAAGPPGMTVTPEGKLSWDADGFTGAYADVQIAATSPGGAKSVQKVRVFMPLKAGGPVAVAPPKPPVIPPRPPVVPPKKAVDPPPARDAGKEVKLPGQATAIAVGGSGRFICLNIPSTRQIAVYDATEGKVVKYLPTSGGKVLIAAGAEKIFVVMPDDNLIQRWDFKTFEKEVTAPLGVKGSVKAALMGSASTGPLWVFDSDRFASNVGAIHPQTLKPIALQGENVRIHGIGEGLRVSADGRTIGTWRFGTSPSGLTVLTLTGTNLKSSYQHDSVGHVAPGPDGRVIHTALGRYTPDGKSIGDGRNAAKGSAYSFPAAQGASLYLHATFEPGFGAKRSAKLAVHWGSSGEKLADLNIPLGEFNQWDREAIGNDQRYMLLPANKSLVVFPETNDKLVVYPFDLDAILAKSGKDFLLVDSPPGVAAVRGQQFIHNLTIKSKKGGVKVKLESGPPGLIVSNDGKVSWAVPKNFADDEVSVIITVSDAAGQESLQTVRLEVRNDKGGPVAVAPPKKDDPLVPPKKDDPVVVPPKKDEPVVVPKDPPPAAKDEVTTVKLPGAANAVAVGAGGKLIILHLPQQKQLAVFDVAQGKVVKYLPTAEATVFIAAGLDHLFVANPTAKVIQRYSLKTFEKEATVQQPIDGTVAGLCMGSNSKGPLLVCPKGDQWGANPVLVDPIKMKVLPGGDKISAAAAPFIRASADGRLFGWRTSTGSEGHSMTLLEVVDGVPKARTFSAGTSLLLPSPDGRYVYCVEGVFNPQFKKLYPTDANRYDKPFLPAASGNLFMQLETAEGGRFPGDPMAVDKPGRVNFFLPGQYRPFASIDKVEGLATESYGYGAVRDPIMHDGRVHLCPDAGRLVVIPKTNDQLILYPFNVEDLLKKSDTDYLLVTSEPPPDAARGVQFAYTPVVRSRKGGVKVKLDSGPEGMRLVDGRLAWRVPDNFADKEVDVILTISDSTGQEVFQTFKLAVRDRKPGEKEAPAEPAAPKVDPKGDKPAGKEDPPVAAKPQDLTLRPAALQKDEQTVNLPSAAASVVPAAGGRLLLIHLPKDRKIAVFDTAEAKIVKYLPLAEDEAKFAAGREKLVVLLPGANVIQRWSLATLEREASVTNPIGSPVKSLLMGSASDGPLIVTTKSAANAFDSPTILFFDPKTFKKSDHTFGEGGRTAWHPQYPPEVRVSANGELLTAWVWGLSPSGVYIWSLEGKTFKGVHHHESWGALLPDPDGRTVFSSGRVTTADGKKLNDAPKGLAIPAVQGPLVLSIDGLVYDPFNRGEKKPLRASVHIDRDSRALITLPELTGLTAGGQLDQRVSLIPGAKLLAILSDAGDKLILHRFDLDALLEKSEVDYLFVTSRAPASAVRGEAFCYDVQVKSRKGGVKFALDASPKGMTISAKGEITWSVPKDFDGDSASVILTVTDKSGQETIHSFSVSVPEVAKP